MQIEKSDSARWSALARHFLIGALVGMLCISQAGAWATKPPKHKPESNPSSSGAVASPIADVGAGVDPNLNMEAAIDITFKSTHLPEYPREAQEKGVTGTVVLRIIVGVDGNARQVDVERSSGSDLLDAAAVNAAKSWRFMPAIRQGRRVEGMVRTPIQFSL